MKKQIQKIIFLVIVLIGLISVTVLGYKRLHNDDGQEDIVIKENVKVITSEIEKDRQLARVEDDCIIFYLDPQYKQGDVIVSGITDFSENGYIRKVIKTEEKEGKFIVETEPAVLTDVFEKAHIVRQFELTEENKNASLDSDGMNMNAVFSRPDIQDTLYRNDSRYQVIPISNTNKAGQKKEEVNEDNGTDYMFGKKFEERDDTVSLSGEAGISAWVEVEMDIDHGDIKCGISVRTKEGAKASLGCGASYSDEWEKQLLKKELPKYEFTVAGIPIVVTNELEISIEADVNLEGNIGMEYELASETTLGFQYNSKTGKVKEINKTDFNSDGLQWNTVSISGDASAGPSVHLITKLYGTSGLDMSFGISGEIEGEAKVSANKNLDGYAGSLDLSISPKIQGEIVVDTPVFDKNLLKQPLFEAELKPFWSKHWESSINWKDDLEWTETGKKGSTYITRYSEVHNISCPMFQFDIPYGWEVESEEVGDDLEEIAEKVVLTNGKGITVTYWDCLHELGGKSRTMLKADISKMADSEFKPSIPDGCGADGTSNAPYANLGNMIVAKVHITGAMEMRLETDYSDIDVVFYAVVPESYIGEMEFVGQVGYVDEFSFPYPGPYAFIAESESGIFTKEEEKQVVSILESFDVY